MTALSIVYLGGGPILNLDVFIVQRPPTAKTVLLCRLLEIHRGDYGAGPRGEVEKRQLRAIREEFNRAYAPRVAPAVTRRRLVVESKSGTPVFRKCLIGLVGRQGLVAT